jgi:hypothetical protein
MARAPRRAGDDGMTAIERQAIVILPVADKTALSALEIKKRNLERDRDNKKREVDLHTYRLTSPRPNAPH